MRVGLYGGSFNPPHIGHSMVCHYLLQTTPLDAIWLIPSGRHPFSKQLVPFELRARLCERLAGPFGGRVQVCTIEGDGEATTYTIDTVRRLQARHPELQFEWIIGSDILRETHKWKDFDLLQTLLPFRVLGRQGFSGGETPAMPEVSSTEIRQRLAQGLSVASLVPHGVLELIQTLGLYATSDGAPVTASAAEQSKEALHVLPD